MPIVSTRSRSSSGRWASGPDEVAIDAGHREASASRRRRHRRRRHDRSGAQVHDRRARQVRERRLARRGDGRRVRSEDGAAAVRQAGRGRPGRAREQGRASPRGHARGASLSALAGTPTKVQTAQAADPFDFKGLQGFVTFIKIFLLAFAGIALFVGAFIIFNTFAITVAQRTREFALLRTIGASRRQVLRSVVLEALIIGLAATIVGAALGVLIAKFLSAVMKAGRDRPAAGGNGLLAAHGARQPARRRRRDRPRQHHPGGAGDPRCAGVRAPRGLDDAEVAAVARDAVHRDRRSALGGFALLLFGMFGHGGGAWVHVLTIAGGRSRCSSASRCSRLASFVRSRGRSALRRLASRAHLDGSPGRTRRAIPAARPSLLPR